MTQTLLMMIRVPPTRSTCSTSHFNDTYFPELLRIGLGRCRSGNPYSPAANSAGGYEPSPPRTWSAPRWRTPSSPPSRRESRSLAQRTSGRSGYYSDALGQRAWQDPSRITVKAHTCWMQGSWSRDRERKCHRRHAVAQLLVIRRLGVRPCCDVGRVCEASGVSPPLL